VLKYKFNNFIVQPLGWINMEMEVKMFRNKITLVVGALFLVALFMSTGCASKKYVMQEMAELDQKVEGVQGSVEENQTRLKEHDERLTSLGSLITQQEEELSQQKTDFGAQMNEVKKQMKGTLVFEEMLRGNTTFKFDSFELSDEAKVYLDQFVQTLIEQDKGVYLEIQGHTDNTGEEEWNLILGKKRAEAVMEYLHKQYRIPLHRMAVISYGSESPISDNSTRDGRAENRRVVILVYE